MFDFLKPKFSRAEIDTIIVFKEIGEHIKNCPLCMAKQLEIMNHSCVPVPDSINELYKRDEK